MKNRFQVSGLGTRGYGRSPDGAAFTLIEMIVVISIIGLLAALIIPIAAGAKRAQMRTRARTEMAQVETAIEEYKSKQGYYPPDNAPNWALNQLYYELEGVTNSLGTYQTLDGNSQIASGSLGAVYGPNVAGFMNNAKGGDEGPTAQNFFRGAKATQYLAVTNGSSAVQFTVFGMLSTYAPGPTLLQSPTDPTGSNPNLKINPWRYNSSSPKYNTKTFDLWMDIIVGGETNRICNWSPERPIKVTTPY